MENQEQPMQDRERAWLERKELDYRESIAAAESLYQMSLDGEQNEGKIEQYCDAIWRSLGAFQDRLIEKEKGQFFETLPILNKIASVSENFDRGENYSIPSRVRVLSSEARYILSQGFWNVDETTLAQLDGPKSHDFFEALKTLLTSEHDFAIENAVQILRRHKNLFERLSEEKQQFDILKKSEELQAFLKTREFEEALVDAIQRGIEARKSPRKMKADIAYCRDLLTEVLGRYGFDPEEILSVWQSSYTEHGGPEPQIRRNMDKVFRLEDQREGIVRFLYKEFGIRNFERYPESILVAQYDEFEDVEKPYGVLLEATSDYNGAFSAWGQAEIWERLYAQIKEQYALRVAEAKSKQDIARLLIRLNRKYGDHHKIAFAFIGGHGSEHSILFGGSYRRHRLLSEDLAGRGVARTGDFFEPHPTIVLVSCSTGVEGGIGQELSKVLGAKVIAPRVPANLKNITADLSKAGIDFEVEYDKPSGSGQEPDIGHVYSRGEKTNKRNE